MALIGVRVGATRLLASGIMLAVLRWRCRFVCIRACPMSYDVNRLRGVHPPACTCVECTQRRNRGRRRSGGGGGPGGGGPGRRRFGCLPFLMALAGGGVISALLAVLV